MKLLLTTFQPTPRASLSGTIPPNSAGIGYATEGAVFGYAIKGALPMSAYRSIELASVGRFSEAGLHE